MINNRRYPLARAAVHGLAILGLVFAAGASATPAHAAPPLNDSITSAIKITTNYFAAAITDINTATLDAGDPILPCENGAGTGDATVWYTFSPTQSGVLSLNTNSSGYDTVVAVFIGDSLSPPTLTVPPLGCNNDVDAWVKTSSLTVNLRGGIKYYIEVARDSLSPAPTPPDGLRLNFTFTPKLVAWGSPAGTKWDSNFGGAFTYSAGWRLLPFLGAYKGGYRVSYTVNGTAVAYFDGISFDLGYIMGPGMGWLEVRVDDIIVGTIGQNAGAYSIPPPVLFGPYPDGVHKLTLRHTPGFSKVNFDYITVYSFPDFIPPAQITDLNAATGTTTGRVTLYWTSVGDDGLVGTAKSYEVQYMLNDGINTCAADWGNPFIATPINWGLPVPLIAGTPQQATLSGLAPGVDYLFCIAAIDDGGNYGPPSNGDNAIAYAGVPYGTGVYDDRHLGWTYTGNWKAITYVGARFNTLHVSNKEGDTASFYFTGTQFVLTYSVGPLGGLLDVYIDGLYETTIDTYAPWASITRYYTSPMQHLGPHSVRLVHSLPSSQVTIDQIYINSPVDDGPPDPISDLTAAPGFNDGEVDLTWTATGDDPSNVGTAVKYEVRYSSNPILTENDWFYAIPAGGLIPAPQPWPNLETMTVVGLTPGVPYYFAVLAYDDATYRVLSSFSGFEYSAAAYGGLWQGIGFYDDTDPSWTYNGMWLQQFPPLAANGTQHISSLYATSAVFHFNGTGFILSFQKSYFLGSLTAYVDGIKVFRIYQSTLPYGYQSTWDSITYLGPLPPGNHVVEFKLTGRATIDEIQIIP